MKQCIDDRLICPSCRHEHGDIVSDFMVLERDGSPELDHMNHDCCDNCCVVLEIIAISVEYDGTVEVTVK